MRKPYMTYSIIIPHKDTPVLLQRCVDSIPVREDIQIIVIDDNSALPEDDWNTFRTKNPGVTLLLTKEGGGAGYARNVGLEEACGDWIIFADADDFFYEGAFDVLDRYAQSGNDVFYFPCDSRDGVTLELIEDRMPSIRKNIRTRNLDGLRYRSIVPWGKMIGRSLISENDLRFEEVEVSNDVMFSIRLGSAAKRPEVIPSSPLYCCTKNGNSLVHKMTVKRLVTRIQVARRANDYLHERNLDRFRIPIMFVGHFLPWHPVLFLWGLWMFRYKGDLKGYLRDLWQIFLAKLHLR
jgi:glycosyltransferase involved in cell wall biosynthesis